MIECSATLIGKSPIGFGKAIESKRDTGEAHDAFEERTWRERCHVNSDGELFIPPMALKLCLTEVAKYLSESVPGKGKATFTKHFKSGIMVVEPMLLGVKAGDVESERLFVPSDGRAGGGSRVWKVFPLLREWKTHCQIIVLDPLLIDKPEKVQEYLSHAGSFIGMGRFRPANNGYYGRWDVKDFAHTRVKNAA